ncbi:uncharacterized protein B0H18DRAFT_1001147, partial [Fomitopsis serialis]|uniref:uncharacterized protein n=1 Tax=Fomitopsis serialis TaxID=139415 RepID=UPI0020083A2E
MDFDDDDIPEWLKPKRNKHIALPQALLDELKSDPDLGFDRSIIHHIDDMSLGTRDALLKCYVLGEGDHYVNTGESWEDEDGDWSLSKQFYPGSNSTYLHFAARLGDVPSVYECIRLGVDATRFHYDLVERTRLGSDASTTIAHLKPRDSSLGPHEGGHLTPVRLAWYALDLELIELFAIHGAAEVLTLPVDIDIHSGRAPLWAANAAKIPSFSKLVSRLARDGLPSRPPRRCPCWSGKLLSQCHESGYHPYPSDFPCVCGMSKTYAKCCEHRNFEILEKWDVERKRLTVLRRVVDDNSITYQNPFSVLRAVTEIKEGDMEEEKRLVEMAIKLNDTMSEQKADPAFRHVLSKYLVLPRPMNKRYTKNLVKTLSDNWNAAVDEYIALGTDSRSVLEIEQAAKFDSDFGPMWKSCEAPGCTAIERPGVKMKCCSGCKTTYYCSAKCQKTDWKKHKAECKEDSQYPQALRSQVIYSAILDEIVRPLHEEDALLEY